MPSGLMATTSEPVPLMIPTPAPPWVPLYSTFSPSLRTVMGISPNRPDKMPRIRFSDSAEAQPAPPKNAASGLKPDCSMGKIKWRKWASNAASSNSDGLQPWPRARENTWPPSSTNTASALVPPPSMANTMGTAPRLPLFFLTHG